MDEQVVKDFARVLAINAEIDAIKVAVEGMLADNQVRLMHGEAQAWPGSCFNDAAKSIEDLAAKLNEMA
jgi:hypothetical protein